MSTNPSTPRVLLLSAPSPQSLEDPSVPNVPVSTSAPVTLDNLGPVVVNSDGVGYRIVDLVRRAETGNPQTLSRIANWENMTEAERERTMKVIAARNRARLAKQQESNSDASSTPLSAASSGS